MEQVTSYTEQLKTLVMGYLPTFVMALIVLAIGWWIIGKIGKASEKSMSKLDKSLQSFLRTIIVIILKVLLLISVAGMVGIQTTSFIAILGAAGLAVGLALQGTLANFAGGVLILMFKPFRVGDVIESQGKTGAVAEIQVFNTVLNTLKGETVILPNGVVSNGTIVNFTRLGRILIEIPVDLAGKTRMEDLRSAILPIIIQDKRVMEDPQPMVGISSLKPGSVQVVFRAYTQPENVIPLTGWMIETIKSELEKNQFAGPVPHSFVHTIQEKQNPS